MRSILLKLLTTGGMLAIAGGNLFAGNVVSSLLADLSSSPVNPYLGYTYGYETTLGGTLTAFTTISSDGTFQYFNPGGGVPIVGADPNGATHVGSVVAAANEAILHPGPGQYAVIRYTTPTSGVYSVNGLFSGQDIYGTSTDVHVLVNGTSNFDALVLGFSGIGAGSAYGVSPIQTFALNSLVLSAGSTIDFAVGPNGDFGSDSTGLQATINSIASTPEPGSLVLLFSGVGLLVVKKMNRRRAI